LFSTGLVIDPQLNRLIIAIEQGLGSVGANGTVNGGTESTAATSHLGYNFVGTVQTIAAPTAKQKQMYTQQVFKNNQGNGLQQRNKAGNGRAAPVAVPLHVGDPSKINYVS
jgi:hypothetical protein